MNRTILKSGWAAFVDVNQIKENYSLMFRYLGNARVKVTIFDSNGKENTLCSEMKAAFISQHKAFSLSLESKYCNLKTDISKISKHQGMVSSI